MIEEALHKSLASLQTEVIDLYQVHWPGNIGLKGGPDDWKVAANCVDALEKAKAAGLIRHWGVCNFGTEDLLALDKAGGGGAVTNQLPYNLLCALSPVLLLTSSSQIRLLPHCICDIVVLCNTLAQPGCATQGEPSSTVSCPRARLVA